MLAAPDCDTELVSYEMSLLVEAVGEVLSPALRGGRQVSTEGSFKSKSVI